jgi:nucleotide-binding universal stress UspA family protein
MYKKILVPVDGSEPSALALNEAVKLAKSHGARLKLVHVVNELVVTSPEAPAVYFETIVESLRAEGKRTLEAAVAAVRAQALEPESELVEYIGGRAADLIIEAANKWSPDLIVMGTHGRRGLRRLVLGSDAELVMRSATVPVLLVRERKQ